MEEKIKLRDKLADIALQWQASFGVAPSITSSISEYDAAMLVGMSEKEYSDYMRDKTAVAKGTDFVYRNIRYQVKANRPSGKKGSKVTMVPKATNYVAKTEHSHPLGMVVSTHFRCGKGVKRGLKNGALPFNID